MSRAAAAAAPPGGPGPAARAALERACDFLEALHRLLLRSREQDQGPGPVPEAPGRPDLLAARDLLARRGCRVALAGATGAGKSTLANALLRWPGLLPTGIEETTLTSVVIRSPADGEGEGLVVHYLSPEEALRGVFERPRTRRLFSEEARARARAGAPLETLRAEVARRAAEPDAGDARGPAAGGPASDGPLREELQGFLEAFEERRGVLGTAVRAPLSERRAALAPRTHREAGHLLLVERAELRVRGADLLPGGVELVDLPGPGALCEAQARDASELLSRTDLLLAVFPGGSDLQRARVADTLLRFARARGAIGDRVFVVLNRLDEASEPDGLPSAEAALAWLQGLRAAVQGDCDPGRLFFTTGLWAQLEDRLAAGDGGMTSAEDEQELLRVRSAVQGLAARLEDQGVADRVAREWGEARLAEALRALGLRGGVDRLRAEVLAFARGEGERGRLSEAQGRLRAAMEAALAVVGPERAAATELFGSARERVRATGAFLDHAAYETRDALLRVHGSLVAREAVSGETAFQAQMRGYSLQFAAAIEGVLAQDNPLIDFRRLAREAGPAAGAQDVMVRVIDRTRSVLAGKFVDLLVNRLAGEVFQRCCEVLRPLGNERALAEVELAIAPAAGGPAAGGPAADGPAAAGRPDLRSRYEARLQDLGRSLRLVTRVRALEETWKVAELDFHPSPGPRPFEEVEAAFRRALCLEMQEVWGQRFQVLAGVLPEVHRVVLLDFADGFEEIAALAQREARLAGAGLPLELLAERGPPEERRRWARVQLCTTAEAAEEALRRSGEELASHAAG